MKFDLVRPCPHCPFRTDREGYLRPERAQEIATSLARGAEFPCHQTTVEVEDEDGMADLEAGPDSQFCAGALIALERSDTPNQIMRVAERIGVYDRSRLDMDSPVGTIFDFQRVHDDRDSVDVQEPCHISGYACEAPAGYLEDGVVIDNVIDFEIPQCQSCWEYTCESCGKMVGEKFLCELCQEGEDE